MVGNIWVADSAEVYGIEFPKLVEAIIRHHSTRCQVSFAAPAKGVPVQLKPIAHPAASSTRMPSGTTSTPMPSPAITAIAKVFRNITPCVGIQ